MVTLAFENEDRIKDNIGAVTSAEDELPGEYERERIRPS